MGEIVRKVSQRGPLWSMSEQSSCSSTPKQSSATAVQSISLQVPAGIWPASLRKLLGPSEMKLFIPQHGCCPQGMLFLPLNFCVYLLKASRLFWGQESCSSVRAVRIVELSKAFRMYLWFSSVFKHAFLRKLVQRCLDIAVKPISCLQVKKLTVPCECQTRVRSKQHLSGRSVEWGVLSRVFMRLSQVEWENVEPDPEGWRFLWGYKPLLPKKEGEWYFFPSFLACCLTPKWEHDCIGSPAYWLLFPVLASVFTASLVEFLSSVRIWHSAALPPGAIELWPLHISQIIRDPKAAGSATMPQLCTDSLEGGRTQDLNPE